MVDGYLRHTHRQSRVCCIGTVFAAYFAVFGLIDAKSTQEETRASLERSLFVTLVSSGNAASFVAAMKDLARLRRCV